MSKKSINQKTNHDLKLVNLIESNFLFNEKPINRLNNTHITLNEESAYKMHELTKLRAEINSIQNCSLKNNSQKLVLGDGNINSLIMLIGEAPGIEEEKSGTTFMGEAGKLLKKMLYAIDIKKEKIYSSYAVNFRPPEDRKPTSVEIKRYSLYLQKHISIIKPKIIILMGSTAMEALTGLNSKISIERGKWKEVIVKNTNYNIIITFNPSYLLRIPENKKYSWEDLKKIKKKVNELNLKI
jgi:uracil-DNA glycosylase family 4